MNWFNIVVFKEREGNMRKAIKLFTVACLLLSSLAFNVPIGYGQSLADEREQVIEMFMMGITENFTYEEVEAYVREEEAYILETGNSRNYSSYGINGNHSTGQALMLAEYLDNYLAANTTESQIQDLYPYAVDFTQLPISLNFYEAGGDDTVKFTVENDGNYLTIHSVESYPAFEQNQYTFSGGVENNQTKSFDVRTRDGAVRTVNVNTEMSVWTTAHRRDLSFYFFHNAAGGLSMVVWELENPQSILMEYTTIAGNEASESAVKTVNTLNRAPYLQEYYYYRGAGSQLEGGDNYRHVTLQFSPDENGLYQFVKEEWIFGEYSDTTYVYQITDQGIYEQAYFETANQEMIDYRYHEDAMNELSSLILPAEVYPGLTFNSGYRDQTQYEVFALYNVFSFGDMPPAYGGVIELRYQSEEDSDTYTHVFFSANIGVIGEAYYIESADTYNLIYFLDHVGGDVRQLSSTPPSFSQEGDYPYAVESEDLDEVVSFFSPGITNINLVNFHSKTHSLDAFYNDLNGGGYDFAYSTSVQLTQVPTQEIELERNSELMRQYDLPSKVSVNTQLIALTPSQHKDAETPFYLFYNASGGISLAYWNDTSAYGPSNGYYIEMVPLN